jgi:TPR repeat protein
MSLNRRTAFVCLVAIAGAGLAGQLGSPAALAQRAPQPTMQAITLAQIEAIAVAVKAKGNSHDTNAELAEANPPGGLYALRKHYAAHPGLIALALKGNAHATLLLGLLYNTGIDPDNTSLDPAMRGTRIEADVAKSVRLVRIAAEADDPFAQRQMGEFYLRGRGVPMDAVEAERWANLFRNNKLYSGATRSTICIGNSACPQ